MLALVGFLSIHNSHCSFFNCLCLSWNSVFGSCFGWYEFCCCCFLHVCFDEVISFFIRRNMFQISTEEYKFVSSWLASIHRPISLLVIEDHSYFVVFEHFYFIFMLTFCCGRLTHVTINGLFSPLLVLRDFAAREADQYRCYQNSTST